jgi:hypothetical protein
MNSPYPTSRTNRPSMNGHTNDVKGALRTSGMTSRCGEANPAIMVLTVLQTIDRSAKVGQWEGMGRSERGWRAITPMGGAETKEYCTRGAWGKWTRVECQPQSLEDTGHQMGCRHPL